MLSCIIVLAAIFGLPTATVVAGVGPKRVWSIFRHPFKTARIIGVWGMERYLALKPLNDAEHAASILAIPLIFGFAIWLNFQP